ncbi:hypothetical protein, partial [Sphingobium sp. AM]|uniref:hypothetical protein n=1 Tax=Sphingobium sp. AM TaxID=1176302 RepID=UPI001EDBCA7B
VQMRLGEMFGWIADIPPPACGRGNVRNPPEHLAQTHLHHRKVTGVKLLASPLRRLYGRAVRSSRESFSCIFSLA